MSESLLAKSSVSGLPPKSLVDHTRDVLAAVGFLYGVDNQPTRLAREWLRFFRLEEKEYSRFLVNTLAAAAFHDLGKANDGFQKVVTQTGDQSIRHEHLSGLLLNLSEFMGWLQHNPLLDFEIVLASVISHHLKIRVPPAGGRFAEQCSLKGSARSGQLDPRVLVRECTSSHSLTQTQQ